MVFLGIITIHRGSPAECKLVAETLKRDPEPLAAAAPHRRQGLRQLPGFPSLDICFDEFASRAPAGRARDPGNDRIRCSLKNMPAQSVHEFVWRHFSNTPGKSLLFN